MKPLRTVAAILAATASLAPAATVPAGTQINIRLTDAINTSTAKVDQPVAAVIIAPVLAGDRMAIAAGVKVAAHVTHVKATAGPDDQAELDLAFTQLADAKGHRVNLEAKLASVDNARETVNADGRILGIIASQTGSGRLDQGINKLSGKYSGLANILSTVKEAVLKDADADIDFEAGVEMTIELTKALEWTGDAGATKVAAIVPQDDLYRLVNRQPFRTMAEKPAKQSDITNIMFLGSQQDLENAFQKAGWSTAEKLNAKSKFETFRAMAEVRGYQEAPVSTLRLDGRPPDLVFEKNNDTFAARHHLRIWRVTEQFRGKDVWVGSSTHDTGIDFSEQDRTFIHKVDSQIDRERAKVVSDLLFTGLVQALSLVDRPAVPTDLFNATGDGLKTDGAMAVLQL
jgi:hypothetical protein